MMNNSYLLLKELKIQNASGYNNFYCAGFPALTSFSGFCEALCHKLSDVLPERLTLCSFAVMVHDHQEQEGMARHALDRWKGPNPKELMAPIKHEPKCDMTISLILETTYHAAPRGLSRKSTQSLYSVFDEHYEEISDVLANMQVAGGVITNNPLDEELVYCKKSLLYGEGIDSIEDIIRESKPGYFLASAEKVLDDHTALFDGDVMKAIAHACAVYAEVSETDDEEPKIVRRRAQGGWVTPSNIGYVGLTQPTVMEDARSDAPVVFVEPLTGLVEYVFTTRAWKRIREGRADSKMFFTPKKQGDLYLVAA